MATEVVIKKNKQTATLNKLTTFQRAMITAGNCLTSEDLKTLGASKEFFNKVKEMEQWAANLRLIIQQDIML